jgi:hypothetical protein
LLSELRKGHYARQTYARQTYPRREAPVRHELGNVVRALNRSNTRLIVGATEVIGRLLLDLNDTLFGPRSAAYRPQDTYEEPYEIPRGPSRAETFVGRSAGVIGGISGDITHAIRDSAAVLSRSLEQFSRALELESERRRYGGPEGHYTERGARRPETQGRYEEGSNL